MATSMFTVDIGDLWSSAIPIPFSTFREDMKEKWRMRWGSPGVRDELERAQAAYYLAQAQQAIPAQARLVTEGEIPYRKALADQVRSSTLREDINPELFGSFMEALRPLLSYVSLPTSQSTFRSPYDSWWAEFPKDYIGF